MKKLLMVALVLCTIQMTAQERSERKEGRPDFTPEEMAQLQTKQMILELDLTEAQEKEVYKMNLENAKARKTQKAKFSEMKKNKDGDKPNKEAILKMKNDMLDAQIANKRKMKALLNEKQYEKWEKMQAKRKNKMDKKKMMKQRKGETRGEHGRKGKRPHDGPPKD